MKKSMQMVVISARNGYIVCPPYSPGDDVDFDNWFVFRDSSDFNFWLQEIEQERRPIPYQFTQCE